MKKSLLAFLTTFVAFTAGGQTNVSSLQFDGIGSYVEIADAPSLNPINALTIEAWIKPDSFGVNAYSNYIVGKDDWSTSSAGYCLRCGAGGELSFNFSDGLGGWKEALSAAVLDTGVWTHVAGVFDGSKLTVYINGVLSGTTLYSGTIHSSSYPVRIGAVPYTSTGPRAFGGRIDQVDIWNKALTPNEITQYKSCSPTGSELGLVGAWKFEEGTGTNTLDYTTFGNDGVLMNGVAWSTDAPTLNCSVGIAQVENSVFSISPNPGNGQFTMTFNNQIESGEFSIYSILCEKILSEKLSHCASKEIQMNTLSKGIYFVKISGNGIEAIQKLIVE